VDRARNRDAGVVVRQHHPQEDDERQRLEDRHETQALDGNLGGVETRVAGDGDRIAA
jgi:hypothetical protein